MIFVLNPIPIPKMLNLYLNQYCRAFQRFLKKALLVFWFIILSVSHVLACNYSYIDIIGSPVDNGNGTYTITLEVCIGVSISWGGTTDFTITPSGGTYSGIASIQKSTFTTSYNYCSNNCSGGSCAGSTLSGGCASAVVNAGTYINFPGCGNQHCFLLPYNMVQDSP